MNEEMTFEQANEMLEEAVYKLENSALPLAESMKNYIQACELLAFCIREIETCKGQIKDINEMLDKLKSDNGELL